MAQNKSGKNNEAEKDKFSFHNLTKRQKNWIYTGIFLAIVLTLFIVNNTNDEPEQGPYPPNYIPEAADKRSDAPAFVLPDINGGQVSLADYKGKIVILDFWATWCGPCRRGIPDLIELKKEYNESLEIIGVSVDGITRDGSTVSDIKPFMKEFGINYPIALGDLNLVNSYGGITTIPTTFIIDKQGRLAARYERLVAKSTYVNEIKKLL